MQSTARTVCDPNCHANPKCGLQATIEDEKIIAVSAADYPLEGFKGRICLMGRSRLDYQYHPDRLRTPLKRVGERGAGEWEAISWEEAISLFVAQHRATSEVYGSKAVAFSQISGAYGLLTRGTLVRYATLTGSTVSKSGGVDYGLAKGLEYMFGIPAGTFFVPGGHAITDAANSDVVILWGSNMAVTRAVDHAPLKAARRTGTRLICIDPTQSETAAWCDEWISIRPGSDGALAWSLAQQIVARGWFDETFLIDHTDMPFLVNGATGNMLRQCDLVAGAGEEQLVWCNAAQRPVTIDEAQDVALTRSATLTLADGDAVECATVFANFCTEASAYTPSHAAEITGIPSETIEHLAETYASAKPGAIRMGYGLDRWYYSDSTSRAIATLACLTGNIGKPGGGVSITSGGQGLPLNVKNYYVPDGVRANAMNMMQVDSCVRTGEPYPIKMECIALGNPFNQVKPDRARVLSDYVANLDFICVIDHFMTDTAKQADLVLPACTIFERTDIVTDSFIQLQQQVVPPEGEAKSDFEIFCLLGKAMGLEEYFDKSAEEYLSEALEASTSPLLEDVTWERLQKEKVIYPWPDQEPYVGFRDRTFATGSGRIECFQPRLSEFGSALPVYREPVEASPKNPLFKKYPLVLLSSHSRYRIHSTFANMPLTLSKEPEPVMRINPADAQARGLKDGDVAEVTNDRGLLKIICQHDDRVRQGTVLVSEGHWVDQFIEGDPYVLTHDAFNQTAENYAHYDVLVEVS